jgi:SAM-dependent methyltransferase
MDNSLIQNAPEKSIIAKDELRAADAYKLAEEGTSILWQGDFQNAKHLLEAMKRRLPTPATKASTPEQSFRLHRKAQAHRARILSQILIPVRADFSIDLNRAPDLKKVFAEVLPAQEKDFLISLRDLLALISAHEWRKNGLYVDALDEKIHPHYGVFFPVRGEYLDLIWKAPLPSLELAFDIGTGTGVIAALLVRRGVRKVIATDLDDRALACAQENIERLHLGHKIEVQKKNLFPEGRAPLIVCNPPWLPETPTSTMESAVYDPDSQMLKSFLSELKNHLTEQGEGWLIISDLAEHLGLRSRVQLESWITAAGLQVHKRLDITPSHKKSKDAADPLSFARSQEITSLWRLQLNGTSSTS